MQKYKELINNLIHKHVDVESKNVLEVGGTPAENEIASELIEKFNVSEVTQINIRNDLKNNVEEHIKYYNMDARRTHFENNSFDIIYGTAILEHIHDLNLFFDEMYRVLRNEGVLFLHGGPLWNCKHGHHLWVHTDGVKYEFNGNNPIEDWSHLFLSPEEMRILLGDKKIPMNHIDKIINMIYYNAIINRVSYGQLMNLVKESKFELVEIQAQNWGQPSKGIQNKIPMDYLNIGAVCLALKKSTK